VHLAVSDILSSHVLTSPPPDHTADVAGSGWSRFLVILLRYHASSKNFIKRIIRDRLNTYSQEFH